MISVEELLAVFAAEVEERIGGLAASVIMKS